MSYAQFPHLGKKFPSGWTQEDAALRWMMWNRVVWAGQTVKRGQPMYVSPAWRVIAIGLQVAGIYSFKSNPWDIRIDKLIKKARRLR